MTDWLARAQKKFSEESQRPTANTAKNPISSVLAVPHSPSSQFSETPPAALNPDLERRIRAMARRWRYSDAELADVLQRARANPAGWLRAVTRDEERAPEFKRAGVLVEGTA